MPPETPGRRADSAGWRPLCVEYKVSEKKERAWCCQRFSTTCVTRALLQRSRVNDARTRVPLHLSWSTNCESTGVYKWISRMIVCAAYHIPWKIYGRTWAGLPGLRKALNNPKELPNSYKYAINSTFFTNKYNPQYLNVAVYSQNGDGIGDGTWQLCAHTIVELRNLTSGVLHSLTCSRSMRTPPAPSANWLIRRTTIPKHKKNQEEGRQGGGKMNNHDDDRTKEGQKKVKISKIKVVRHHTLKSRFSSSQQKRLFLLLLLFFLSSQSGRNDFLLSSSTAELRYRF